MSKGRPLSAGAAVRPIALGAALCALTVAPACGRQTFDLLQNSPDAGGSVSPSGGAGTANDEAGAPDGGSQPDAGAGRAGSLGGHGGFGASGYGGGSVEAPCLPGEECTDGGLTCPPTVMFCNRCKSNKDCSNNGDAPFCDEQDGRCAQCRVSGNDCASDQVCHPLTLRCAPFCQNNADCADDKGRPVCDPFHACVACAADDDCKAFFGKADDVCFFGSCVECYDNTQCPLVRPYCVGLRCQTRH